MNEVKFFTRSVRKSRNGYVVFLLDRKTDQQPIEFNDLEFSILCQKYANDLKNTQFTTKVDQIKEKLLSNPESRDPYLTKYRFEAKNQFTVRSSIDSKQRALRAKIEKLENAQTDVSKTEKPQKAKVQKQLSKLRSQLESLTNERTAVMKVLEKAETLAVDNSWIELERNQGSAVFGSLSRVYSVRGKQIEDEQKETMSTNLELSRAMLARDGVIKDLLTANLLK